MLRGFKTALSNHIRNYVESTMPALSDKTADIWHANKSQPLLSNSAVHKQRFPAEQLREAANSQLKGAPVLAPWFGNILATGTLPE